jgi:1-acyl-sn-glycerol-3-phosphate acyltransferase
MTISHPRSKPLRYILSYVSVLLCVLLTRYSVSGANNLPKEGPYILAPNHIDDVDPVPIAAAVKKPITFLMAQDQAELPWYKAWGPWSYGVLLVNRANVQISTIKKIQKQINKKERICIFPEGTIKGEGLKEGKRGVAYFAIKNEIPIIPTAIIGTKGIIEKIKKLKRERVKVVFGKPIFVKKGDEEKKITQQVMATLKKMLPADHT